MREDTPDRRRLVVGIDPGVSTGFAIWDAGGAALLEVCSLKAAEAVMRLQILRRGQSLHLVVFEDARLHGRRDKAPGAAMGAGSIRRDCQILADWLKLLDIPHRAVSPKAKGAKFDADRFAQITGWQGRTNEHGRDAAMLVFGWRL